MGVLIEAAKQALPVAEPMISPAIDLPERSRQAIAAALGIRPDAIEAEWPNLVAAGGFFHVKIGHFRGTTDLKWGDLGLTAKAMRDEGEADESVRLFRAGRKYLLKPELLNQINALESQARKYLYRQIQTPFGYFVPVTAMNGFLDKMGQLQAKFFALRDEIVAGYDQHRRELLLEYARRARASWRTQRTLDPESMDEEDRRSENRSVAAQVTAIAERMPTAEGLRDSFSFSLIPLELNLAGANPSRSRITTASAIGSLIARENEISAMRLRLAQTAQVEQQRQVGEFLKDVVSHLRSLVYDATTDVLAALKKNGRLVTPSILSLKNMIEAVGSLNFYGDAEIEASLNRVQKVLSEVQAHSATGADIERQLQAIATVCRATLLDLGEQPRSARDLGVADSPSEAAVEAARRIIGVEAEAEALAVPVRRSVPLQDAD